MTGTKEKFTQHHTASHRTANYVFLPFLTRILGPRPALPRSSAPDYLVSLPADEPAFLTREAVEASMDIINKGVMRFICRDCGSTPTTCLDERGRLLNEKRIWEVRDIKLKFSDQSLTLLIHTFNKAYFNTSISTGPLPDCLSHNGDTLLHHVLFRNLHRQQSLSREWLRKFSSNPLNRISHFPFLETLSEKDQDLFIPLTDPGLFVLFPWLPRDFVKLWISWEDTRWSKSREYFSTWNKRQKILFEKLIEYFKDAGRPDALVFLLDYYKYLVRDNLEPEYDRYHGMLEHLKVREQQELGRTWVDSFRAALRLNSIYLEARRKHPADRDPEERMFMAAYQNVEFNQAVESINRNNERVLPRVT